MREYTSNVLTSITDGHSINLFRVQNLNVDCSGEVIAIEFCYQYYITIEPGEAIFFNWTVLILEETNVFTITRIITIESHPKSLGRDYCMDVGGGQVACCDREYISNLNFQTNSFIFGVTESARGNTHDATLLGFHESQLEYSVDTLQISATELSIAVGSNLRKPGVLQRGLRMLWFVIGKSAGILLRIIITVIAFHHHLQLM